MGCSANFLAFHYLRLYRIHLVLRMPPGNVGIAILPYCDLFVLSQGTEGGKQGRSSHTKQGEIKFTVSEYHTVTSDFNAHRGIKRDYLDSMVGASQPLATLCSEETGLVGSKKKKRIPNTECVTVSSALLPSNPSCSCSAACPLPLLPTPLHWGSPLQMRQFKMACLFSREGTRPTLSRWSW